MLGFQRCNLVQRYDTSNWLQLAEVYTEFSSRSNVTKYSNAGAKSRNSDVMSRHPGEGSRNDSKYSNADDVMDTIVSNTVTLFRPYFHWKKTQTEATCLTTVWQLLGRIVSVETFLRDLQGLPWEQHHQRLELLFLVSSLCCLLWARYCMVQIS